MVTILGLKYIKYSDLTVSLVDKKTLYTSDSQYVIDHIEDLRSYIKSRKVLNSKDIDYIEWKIYTIISLMTKISLLVDFEKGP